MKITVEIEKPKPGTPSEVVYISFDWEGLQYLRECLAKDNFRKPGDDVELFSADWGGWQLDGIPYHEGLGVVHKLELQLRVDADENPTK